MPLLEPARSRLLRYGCAVFSTALMLALRLALPLGQGQRFSTFYFAVIFTAWFGGLGPSILAIVLACLAVFSYFLLPLNASRTFPPAAFLGMGLYVAVCSAIVAFSEAGRAALRRLEREVGERRRAEQAERAERERHQTTLASVGDGVIVTDAGGRVVSLNPVAEDLTGWLTVQAVGRPLKQVFRTRDEMTHESAEMPLAQVVRGGVTRQMDQTELAARGGAALPIEHCTAPIRDERGIVTGVVIVFRDITERKGAEQALRDSEEQYKAIYSQAAIGIAEADLLGRLIRANNRFCEILGYDRAALLGRRFVEFTAPADRLESLECFQTLLSGGPMYAIEKRYVRKDETIVWARVAVSLIRDSAGQPARVVAVIEDITERKRLESELQRRVAELAEADRRKDEFLATLAHELRNPLAPIRNALHLMGEPSADARALEPERAMAERHVVHLARLIDDLMDIARISRGKIALRKETLLLAPLIERAVASVRPALESRGHRLEVVLPEAPVSLAADPTRLEQILGNLLNNAIKYTEPGGTIQVHVEPERDHVVLRVCDSGIGIAPELLPRIFDLFVQAENHRDRSQGGLGIGLSLVRRLVEMHGGTITAHSAGPHRGSQFVVRLPALPASHSKDGQKPSEHGAVRGASRTPPRRRILVVDDNHDAANSLARLLKRLYGQDVHVAHDGPAALESVDRLHPEVVLLDIGMPGMDGYEVAQRLRKKPELAALKIVALTGWGQEADRVRSRAVGFDHHLVKPVDPADLCKLLEE
jgi:PAS domain S-box-containing protein